MVGSRLCATCRGTPASLREDELTAGDAQLKRERKKDQMPSFPQHLVPCHVHVCSSWLPGTSVLPALPWRCSDLQLFVVQDPVSVSCCKPRPAVCNQAPVWASVPCLGNDGLSSGLCSCPGGVLAVPAAGTGLPPKELPEDMIVPNLRDEKLARWGGGSRGTVVCFLPTLLIRISVPHMWQL